MTSIEIVNALAGKEYFSAAGDYIFFSWESCSVTSQHLKGIARCERECDGKKCKVKVDFTYEVIMDPVHLLTEEHAPPQRVRTKEVTDMYREEDGTLTIKSKTDDGNQHWVRVRTGCEVTNWIPGEINDRFVKVIDLELVKGPPIKCDQIFYKWERKK